MRRLRIVAPLVALTAMTLAPPAEARTDNRSKPVIFVHGLDAFGTAGVNCSGSFANMKTTLASRGFAGPLRTVKYYEGDSSCDTSLDDNGSHSTHDASGHGGGSHNADADIRHLSYHLAWMIWTDYTRNGVTVDLVGHSMGGLISRYMVHRIQANDPAFPSYLYVEDVVTLGTPHLGSGWASGCPWSTQCNQMENGSSFINYLGSNASNPQADGGTDWTAIGSYDDGIVAEGSAVGMGAAHKVNYLGSMNIGHPDYMHDTSGTNNADVEWWDTPGPWYAWYDAPHVVPWSDRALTFGSW